jgi:hypothetical protein
MIMVDDATTHFDSNTLITASMEYNFVLNIILLRLLLLVATYGILTVISVGKWGWCTPAPRGYYCALRRKVGSDNSVALSEATGCSCRLGRGKGRDCLTLKE